MQPRFEKRVGSAPFGMVDQARFRAAFDFMRLRADIGEVEEVLADWWQEFSMADDNLRQDLVDQVREEQQKRQRAPRVHRAPAAGVQGADRPGELTALSPDGALRDVPVGLDGDAAGDSGAPRKRRRRRRSGAAKGQGEGGGSADGGFNAGP